MDHSWPKWRGHGNADAQKLTALRGALVAAALILISGAAAADELGVWKLAQTRTPDGSAIHSASIVAIVSADPTGVVDEEPVVLSISCRTRGEPRWSQTLHLNDAMSSSGETTVEVSIDGAEPEEKIWIVDESKRVMMRDAPADIAKLRNATTLTLEWSWGWSWLWLSEEAQFALGEMRPVLYLLSKSCGVPQPTA